MTGVLSGLIYRFFNGAFFRKSGNGDLIRDDRGETNIIAIVLIIIVVIAVAAIFREKIFDLIGRLFTKVDSGVEDF